MPAFQKNIYTFAGGSNTAAVPSYIEDNKASEILNMEFLDAVGTLATRRGVIKVNTVTSFSSKISSIFQAFQGALTLVTSGADIFKLNGAGTFTSIKGALTVQSTDHWMWRQFGSYAIGCNGSLTQTKDNPMSVNSSGVAAALGDYKAAGGTRAYFVEVWGGRVFIVDVLASKIRYSALSDPLTWTVPNPMTAISAGFISVGFGDDDYITGMIAWRGRLIVFKRRGIYQVISGGTSAAPSATIGSAIADSDPTSWRIEKLPVAVGCLSAFGIQNFGQDVLFPCEFGIASLEALYSTEDVGRSIVSRDRPDIAFFDKDQDTPSFVNPFRDQYMFCCNQSGTKDANNDTVYVLDMDTGQPRWCKWSGLIAGNCYARVLNTDDGVTAETWIGGYNNIYRYANQTTNYSETDFFDNGNVLYPFNVNTKVYNMGLPFNNKKLGFWELGVRLLSSPLPLNVAYTFDEDLEKTYSETHALQFLETGGLMGVDAWDAFNWYKQTSLEPPLIRRFGPQIGSRATSAQFNISSPGGVGFILKYLQIESLAIEPRARGIEGGLQPAPPPPPPAITFPAEFVAVGEGTANTAAWSPDGKTWYGLGRVIFNEGYCAAFNGTQWLIGGACGSGALDNAIGYGTDGKNYTGLGHNVPMNQVFSVAWNGTRWVAVGLSGTTGHIAYSANGIAWTDLGNIMFTGSGHSGNDVIWDGTQFIAVGSGTSNSLATSADGITWSGKGQKIVGSASFQIQSIAYNGTRYVALADGDGVSTAVLYYSSDALTWTKAACPFDGGNVGQAKSVAWNGTIWVATGWASGLVRPTLAYSTDGITWTNATAAGSYLNQGFAAAWNGQIWVAVGASAAGADGNPIWSLDGINWNSATNAAGSIFNAPVRGCAAGKHAPYIYPPLV